jgi:predicted methyltransferase
MTVELLWWEGCPSHPETLADLERILREEGIGAEVRRVEIENDEQARREHFPGSPTIRVDGEDIFPAEETEPYSLTCRVYRLRDGRVSPTPDPEDLRDALRERTT